MTEELLKKSQELLGEIENLNTSIQRLMPYEGCKVAVSINKSGGCGSDNGEVILKECRDLNLIAAMIEVLRNHRDTLKKEFDELGSNLTADEVSKMEPVKLVDRLWFGKWFKIK